MVRYICIGLCVLAIAGCGRSGTESATMGAVAVSSIDVDSFARIKGIPERAKERSEQAFDQFRSRSEIASYLVDQGFSGDVLARLEAQEAVNRIILAHYVNGRIEHEVTASKIAEYYEAHKEQFAEREYEVSHMFFRVLPSVEDEAGQIANAKAKAEAAHGRLVQGENFAVLAKELSEDQATSNKGGILPTLHSSNLTPSISELLSRMQVDDFSQPVKTDRGFQIFKLNSVKVEIPLLKDVSDRIQHMLALEVENKEMVRLKALAASEYR